MSDIEREAFEREFPVPKDVEWCGNGYAPTKYSADQGYNRMWKVWQAARQAPASAEVEPVAWIRFRSYRIAADDVIEGVEVCEPHEIGDDGSPASPVYLHPPAKVPEALILRKQAEAVEACEQEFQGQLGVIMTLSQHAESIRQQAEALEKGNDRN